MRYKLLSILLLSVSLFGQSFVDMYRSEGIEKIASVIEKAIQSPEYWMKYIQDNNTSFGYFESNKDIIVSSKKQKSMNSYSYESGKLVKKFSETIITGKNGDKQKEGDLKTPIGVYTITSRFQPKDIYYGPIAFSLSYPNLLDKLNGKNGYGIWIHGYPTDGSQRPKMSKGCLVLKNDLLLTLDKKIDSSNSIAITYENEIYKADKNELSQILALLYQWRAAWKQSNIDKYLGYYSKNFRRFDGKDFIAFSKYKAKVFKRKEKKKIIFKDISIIPYPTEDQSKKYLVKFYEDYSTATYKFQGDKELYIAFENNTPKIIAEK